MLDVPGLLAQKAVVVQAVQLPNSMGNASCSRDDAVDTHVNIISNPSVSKSNVDADSAVITAAIDQLQHAHYTDAAGDDPSVFFSGEIYDSCDLANRLSFFPANTERVIFSGFVSKINKRGKHQDRIFACTDQAFYNLDPKEGCSKCLRRIPLHSIGSIFVNRNHTSAVIRVENSYDYIFTADRAIVDAFASLTWTYSRMAATPGNTAYVQRKEDSLWNLVVKKGDDNGRKWKQGGRMK